VKQCASWPPKVKRSHRTSHLEPPVLALPRVKRRITHAVPAAQLGNWCPGLLLLQVPMICSSVYRDRFIRPFPSGPDSTSLWLIFRGACQCARPRCRPLRCGGSQAQCPNLSTRLVGQAVAASARADRQEPARPVGTAGTGGRILLNRQVEPSKRGEGPAREASAVARKRADPIIALAALTHLRLVSGPPETRPRSRRCVALSRAVAVGAADLLRTAAQKPCKINPVAVLRIGRGERSSAKRGRTFAIDGRVAENRSEDAS